MTARDLRQRADDLAPELIRRRRDLHRHPELGFEEVRTSGLVAERLRELGLEVRTGLARTGVAGILRAKRPRSRGVLLRADMDALPVQEIPGREYGSTVPGRMHACGHDGHTAMLLGAAELIVGLQEELPRDVVFCFQPAEEGQGGGRQMVEAGVLQLVDTGAVFALHLWTPFPAGTLHVRSGPTMAAQDEFRARIIGKGGHGALPHRTRDPIVAAAQAIVQLQSIVSRRVDPVESAVVTIGSLNAGSAPNVIPDEARLQGTLRSFSEEVRDLLRETVPAILDATAHAAGCRSEFEIDPGFPAVVNDPQAVQRVREAAAPVFGAENVHEPAPMAASEDFAYYLNKLPGAFILVGAGNAERGITAQHHSPEFDIDESVLPRGAELLARLALHPD